MKYCVRLLILMFFPITIHASHTDVLQSGRDHDVLEINKAAIEQVNKVIDALGISRPPHRLEFVPSEQLSKLASLGGPAIGHWYDGSIVANEARHSMGVLEFVTSGAPTCRSFYSDSVSPAHQIEIFKHVGGHNDMAVNRFILKFAPITTLFLPPKLCLTTWKKLITNMILMKLPNGTEYLLTLSYAQDLVTGSYSVPGKFLFARVLMNKSPEQLDNSSGILKFHATK